MKELNKSKVSKISEKFPGIRLGLGRFSESLHTCHTLKYVSDNFAKFS